MPKGYTDIIISKLPNIGKIVQCLPPIKGQNYFATDLHGANPAVLQEIFKTCQMGKDDRFILGGDAIDREKYSYALIKRINEINKQHDAGENVPQVIPTRGNHETIFMCWYVHHQLWTLDWDWLRPGQKIDEEQKKSLKEKYETIQSELKNFLGESKYNFYVTSYAYQAENGGEWAVNAGDTPETRQQLNEVFEFCFNSFCMERVDLGDEKGSTVVHATLPMPMKKWKEDGASPPLSPSKILSMLEARDEADHPLDRPDGDGSTYCGHSVNVPYFTVVEENGKEHYYFNGDVCTPQSGQVLVTNMNTETSTLVDVPGATHTDFGKMVVAHKHIFITPEQQKSLQDTMDKFREQLKILEATIDEELQDVRQEGLNAIDERKLTPRQALIEKQRVEQDYTVQQGFAQDACLQFEHAAQQYEKTLGIGKAENGDNSNKQIGTGTAYKAAKTFMEATKKISEDLNTNLGDLKMPNTRRALRILCGIAVTAASLGLALCFEEFRGRFFPPQAPIKASATAMQENLQQLVQQTLDPPRLK